MGFGKPTKYWKLDQSQARPNSWDVSVSEASEEYKNRMVSICKFISLVSKSRPVICQYVSLTSLDLHSDFLERGELTINQREKKDLALVMIKPIGFYL